MDIPLLPATEQLAALQQKRISPLELADEYIRRIRRIEPLLNAFTYFDAEAFRTRAGQALPGPLHGLPISIKSSIQVAGMSCEVGSTLRSGTIATDSAEAVQRLIRAGAVIVGNTNCPEFLMSYDTSNDLHGRTNNPWNLARSAGGSSGGEAAAIACCLSAGGLGSDSGGSVRVPAHFTGICALKPTAGRISSLGHQPPCVGPFSSLGAIGPMARSISDVALLFRITAAPGGQDPMQLPLPSSQVSLEDARTVPVLWLESDSVGPVTPETSSAIQQASHALERAGFTTRRLHSQHLTSLQELWRIFFLQCGELFYRSTIAGYEDRMSLHFGEFLREARAMPPLSAAALLEAWAEMDRLRTTFWAELGPCVLLTPVCSTPAFLHGERQWTIADAFITYWESMRFTQWFNVLACPAAVVPVGDTPERLPIGVQLAAAPFQDELVLTVAHVLHATFGTRLPPLAT